MGLQIKTSASHLMGLRMSVQRTLPILYACLFNACLCRIISIYHSKAKQSIINKVLQGQWSTWAEDMVGAGRTAAAAGSSTANNSSLLFGHKQLIVTAYETIDINAGNLQHLYDITRYCTMITIQSCAQFIEQC